MNDSQFFWFMVCQWILAFGTIFLGVAAIWGDLIRMYFFSPKLCIALKNPKGDVSIFADNVVSRFYHLRVWNKRRFFPAHNVRVVLKTMYRPSADGTMYPTIPPGPLQLAWSFQGNTPQFQTIGAESTCDLGHLRNKPGECFKLTISFHHISFDPHVNKNQMIIVILAAISDEVESNELKLKITWDGIWTDDSDEMANHMVIKQLNNNN